MNIKRLMVLLTLSLGVFSTGFIARAAVPVVDLSRSAQETLGNQGLEIDQEEYISSRPVVSHQNEPMDQRILRLERQITNLNEMNYANKLEKLQQEMQQLHGQIEVQNHELSQLKEQIRNFYQDLDERITKGQSNEKPRGEKTSDNDQSQSQLSDTLPSSASDKTKELQTYETAFNLLNKKEYDKAIIGFQSFIKNYPSSNYTVNAHYWLGEIYYLKDKSDQANKEFALIISNYPNNPKVADALLKVALIDMDAGHYTKAKQNLINVQKQFPRSTAAKIATLRLKEIKQKK